jgi:glycosyltransferase involved in cell wall biosynthesis
VVDLVVVNPDYLDAVLPDLPSRGGGTAEHRRVACWFWELEDLPAAWREKATHFDGFLAASAFIADALGRSGIGPVIRVPLPVVERERSRLQRRDLGWPENAFVFLTTFDFHSSVERKNPAGAIEAFARAFAGRRDVALVVKTSNGVYYPEALEKLLNRADRDPRILIQDGIVDVAHMAAMQQLSDAFVSLHRAEGFGLGLAECMAAGKPVVATAWSGNLEFMSDETACMVPALMEPVPQGAYANVRDGVWAEPDVAAAADCMRRLVDMPAFANRMAHAGQRHVRQALAPVQVGKRMGDGFLEIFDIQARREHA